VLKYIELVEQQLAVSSGQDDPWATALATVCSKCQIFITLFYSNHTPISYADYL